MGKRLLATGLALTMAAGVGYATTNDKLRSDVAYNMFGDGTDRERRMSDAIDAMYGTDTSVRCVSPEGLQGKELPGTNVVVGATHDVNWSPTDQEYIRLAPVVCDAIAEIPKLSPGEYKHLPPDSRLRIVAAVSVLAVQGATAKYSGTPGEMECYGTQEAPAVARHLGMNRADSVELGLDLVKAELLLTNPEQRPPQDCVNDGPYDLYPESPFGFFPYGESPSFPVD